MKGHGAPNSYRPFFTTKENGQGLRLTLVREILEQHRFDYTLETPPGGPTQFTIVNAGKVRWQEPSRWPLVGGALVTAGGVVFHGEGHPLGGAFLARDAGTGTLLFRHRTRGGVNAAPVTFKPRGSSS